MMYGNNRQRARTGNPDLFLQRRVLLIVCILLLGVAVALGFLAIRNGTYRDRAEMQFSSRMYAAASSALSEVTSMDSYTGSDIHSQLSRIRQYVDYMEQLNGMSISLAGGEGGRLAPNKSFDELNATLHQFEEAVKKGNPTQDIRKELQSRLSDMQALLGGR